MTSLVAGLTPGNTPKTLHSFFMLIFSFLGLKGNQKTLSQWIPRCLRFYAIKLCSGWTMRRTVISFGQNLVIIARRSHMNFGQIPRCHLFLDVCHFSQICPKFCCTVKCPIVWLTDVKTKLFWELQHFPTCLQKITKFDISDVIGCASSNQCSKT